MIPRSVFWRVAGTLVGVQVVIGLLAVLLGAWFAYDSSLELAANSLRLRIDGLAEEIELRAGPLDGGVVELPSPLLVDLSARFPDPVSIVDPTGSLVRTITPDPLFFVEQASAEAPFIPPADDIAAILASDSVAVRLGRKSTEGWAAAPVYDAAGFLVGGIVVHPLTNSLSRELEEARNAYLNAMLLVAVLAGVLAILLGAWFTWRIVRPLQSMTRQVERIGAGDYDARLQVRQDDEFGRLGNAINTMASQVESSVDALRTADRLRRDLVANVGHDLRTPLATLLGYVEEAERFLGERREKEARDALERAERQGRHVTDLVKDLFELSVLESGYAPLRYEPIPIAELLTDAVRAHHIPYREAGVALILKLPEDLPLLPGDGVRLLRVVDNLLTNVLHHARSAGQVVVSAGVDGRQLVIIVQDDGEGMEAAVVKHVFERYYRGVGPRTRENNGTGLGLPISRAIARAHGGDLEVKSEPGAGSCFMVTLPLTGPVSER